jgi:hypothetical protein
MLIFQVLGNAGTLRATRQLAKVLKKQGKLEEAETLYREVGLGFLIEMVLRLLN